MSVSTLQTLQELVDTAIQSEAPHQPQLIVTPNWLTGAGSDSQEVWRALQTLGMLSVLLHLHQTISSPACVADEHRFRFRLMTCGIC